MAVGQKDRFDFKPLPCELLIDLSAVVGGIKDDRLLLPFPVQVVKIGLDHSDHITAELYLFHIPLHSAALSPAALQLRACRHPFVLFTA